jgi:cytochrome c-type biogenesis protein CcmF
VEEDDEVVGHLRPNRRFFRPTGQEAGMISSYFSGEATSEVGLRPGPFSDLWVAPEPDLSAVQRRVKAADKGFEACVQGAPGTPEQCKALGALMRAALGNQGREAEAFEQISQLQALTAEKVAKTYLADDAPVTFRIIVDPLVTWMWIGGLIALAGALIALWPARGRRRGALIHTEADARKEAKYREIRDAELDHAAGKLSDEDFAAVDAELRREALEILSQVENGDGNGNGNGSHPHKPEKIEQG